MHKIKTVEFTLTDGGKIRLNPMTVSFVSEAVDYTQPADKDGKQPKATVINIYGFMSCVKEDYSYVNAEIFGAEQSSDP